MGSKYTFLWNRHFCRKLTQPKSVYLLSRAERVQFLCTCWIFSRFALSRSISAIIDGTRHQLGRFDNLANFFWFAVICHLHWLFGVPIQKQKCRLLVKLEHFFLFLKGTMYSTLIQHIINKIASCHLDCSTISP